MSKVIFQVGMLAFFVAAVLFGLQGMPLMDMIARSFMVFVAVVAGLTVILMVAGTMRTPQAGPRTTRSRDAETAPGQDQGNASSQAASHTP